MKVQTSVHLCTHIHAHIQTHSMVFNEQVHSKLVPTYPSNVDCTNILKFFSVIEEAG